MKGTYEHGSRLVRNPSSRSFEQRDSSSRIKHTIECTKYLQNDFAKPFVRACGCVHRFPQSNERNKSFNAYNRRSRSCTPMQSGVKKETEAVKSKNNEILVRHTSENNLHLKQIIEIKEKLELVPQFYEKHNSRYQLRCKTLPQRYKTTVYIDLDTSRKKYVEEISLQVNAFAENYESKPSIRLPVSVVTNENHVRVSYGNVPRKIENAIRLHRMENM